jgi:hypothetical protein
MSTITGFGILPFSYRSYLQAPDASGAIAQGQDAPDATSTAGAAASQAGTIASASTGFTAAQRLSADLIGALIRSQSEQSAGGNTSSAETVGQATGLSGASALTDQTPESSDPPSGPPTLQQIAGQFDLHHLTHQQEEQLQGELVSSGTLSEKDGFAFFAKTVLADAFDSQHYRIINGQLVATTPSPPGTLIGNDAPGGQQYDVVQRFQQSLAADQSFGDSQNAAKDQKILDVLNQLDSIRNGGTA